MANIGQNSYMNCMQADRSAGDMDHDIGQSRFHN